MPSLSKRAGVFSRPYRVTKGKGFLLDQVDTSDTAHVESEDAIRETASEHAPWYVVPADNKWFTRLVVAAAVVDALAGLDLHYPKIGAAQRKALAAARRELERE